MIKREREKRGGRKEGDEKSKERGRRKRNPSFSIMRRDGKKRKKRTRREVGGCVGERQRKSIITIIVISASLVGFSWTTP